MKRPRGIPPNYIEIAPGEWAHPSRVRPSDIPKKPEAPKKPDAPKKPGAPTGRQLRGRGVARVLEKGQSWGDNAYAHFLKWRGSMGVGHRFIAENFRGWAMENGLPRPHDEHAWGALFLRIASSGMVIDTGRSKHMEDPRSHGRRSPVYEIVAR